MVVILQGEHVPDRPRAASGCPIGALIAGSIGHRSGTVGNKANKAQSSKITRNQVKKLSS